MRQIFQTGGALYEHLFFRFQKYHKRWSKSNRKNVVLHRVTSFIAKRTACCRKEGQWMSTPSTFTQINNTVDNNQYNNGYLLSPPNISAHFGITSFLQRKTDGNMEKKWSGSAGSAVTETREKFVIPLAETCVCRCVSTTESCVSVTFPFAYFSYFVLWW